MDDVHLVHAAFLGTDALVVVLGVHVRALVSNPALTAATGWTREELARTPFWDVYVVPEDVERARDAFGRAFTEGLAFPQEGDWLDRSGGRRRISMQNTVLRDEHGLPYALVTIGVDVTEWRRQEALLRHEAETDPLTGLRNRRALFDALGTGPAEEPYGLLFCDLDGFKQANDELGHAAGDTLLAEVARRLLEVADHDQVVTRFGGDEFVVLCPSADEQRLAELAARVEAAVATPVVTPHGAVQLGVSIGTALAAPGSLPDDVIRTADRRMYRVKSARRAAR